MCSAGVSHSIDIPQLEAKPLVQYVADNVANIYTIAGEIPSVVWDRADNNGHPNYQNNKAITKTAHDVR